LLTAWNLVILNNDDLVIYTDVLALPPNDFCVWKMFTQKSYHYVKISWVPNDSSNATDFAFTVYVHCIYTGFSTSLHLLLKLITARANFSLSIKRPADVMPAFFYLCKLCCFGYYQKNIKKIIVLETYVVHDVIRSNLVLIVLTLCNFTVKTFLNVRQSLVDHAKHCNFWIVEVNQIWFGV